MNKSTNPLLGKRKKKNSKCPNPLFIKWLTEWRDDASAKGIKSHYNYSKAIKTLKKYPLVINTGKECKFLENFGDKICKMLDVKLAEHIQMYGSARIVPDQDDESDDDVMDQYDIPPPTGPPAHKQRRTSGPRNRQASGEGGGRVYIPQYRSGAYALILTLYDKSKDGSGIKCMKKTELMREAQPLADKSFTLPDPGCRYTSWSSMGTLIKKGFVIKESSPAKYSITESGKELAERILAADQNANYRDKRQDDDNLGFAIGGGVYSPIRAIPYQTNNRFAEPTLPTLNVNVNVNVHREPALPNLGVDVNKATGNKRTLISSSKVDDNRHSVMDEIFGAQSVNNHYVTANDILGIGGNINSSASGSGIGGKINPSVSSVNHRVRKTTPTATITRASDAVMDDWGVGHRLGATGVSQPPRVPQLPQRSMTNGSRIHEISDSEDDDDFKRAINESLAEFNKSQEFQNKTQEIHDFSSPEIKSKPCQQHEDPWSYEDEDDLYPEPVGLRERLQCGADSTYPPVLAHALCNEVHDISDLEEEQLEAALRMSMMDSSANTAPPALPHTLSNKVHDISDSDEENLQAALRMSMMDSSPKSDHLPDLDSHECHNHIAHHLAHQMHDISDSDEDTEATLHAVLSKSLSEYKQNTDSLSDTESHVEAPSDLGMKFWYITDDDKEELSKDKAAVLINEELGIGFLVKAKYEDLLLSGKQYKLDTSRTGTGDYIYAYLGNSSAPELAIPPFQRQPSPVPTQPAEISTSHKFNANKQFSSQTSTYSQSSAISGSSTSKTVSAKTTSSIGAASQNAPSSSRSTNLPSATQHSAASFPPVSFGSKKGPSSTVSSSASSASAIHNNIATEKVSVPDWLKACSSVSSQNSTAGNSQDSSQASSQHSQASSLCSMDAKFVFSARTFDVLLIVDNCEIYGGGKGKSKDALIGQLKKNCVPLEVRKLQVGDFCWIAKPKYGGDKKMEVVLDYIVERKRMDDLASSIVDGRFVEQKQRLKSSGIGNPIYLIEEYGSPQHFSIPEDSLRQAVANTQVIDKFLVKHTKDTMESAAYLTIMTWYLQSCYSGKTLSAFSKTALEKMCYKNDIRDSEARLLTFEDFSQSSVKNKPLTIKELFAKQLAQIHGMSVDKVTAVLEKYHTPQSLITAYERCFSLPEKEELLTSVKVGPMKRAFGKGLSKSIFLLYSSTGVLS